MRPIEVGNFCTDQELWPDMFYNQLDQIERCCFYQNIFPKYNEHPGMVGPGLNQMYKTAALL